MILSNYKGKYVEILISSNCSASTHIEKGVITNIAGYGDNTIFIELDNGKIINARYIIQMSVKD